MYIANLDIKTACDVPRVKHFAIHVPEHSTSGGLLHRYEDRKMENSRDKYEKGASKCPRYGSSWLSKCY